MNEPTVEAVPDCPLKLRSRLTPLFIALAFALTFAVRINSDELQHAHVVWQWSQGLVAYRDFFDNHTPLFHLLILPAFALAKSIMGERASLFLVLRGIEVLIGMAAVAATIKLAARALPASAARWAGLLVMAIPFTGMMLVEFRPDTLWSTLWLAALAVLTGPGKLSRRWGLAGVIFGFDALVSLKTLVLLGALVSSGTVLLFALPRERKPSPSEVAWGFLSFTAGCAAPILAVILLFASMGALDAFWYCAVTHNFSAPLAASPPSRLLKFIFPLSLAPLWFAASTAFKKGGSSKEIINLVFIYLCAAIYLLLLLSYWPLVESQTMLPACVLLAIVISHVLQSRPAVLKFACLAGLLWLPFHPGLNPSGVEERIRRNDLALKLAAPGEFVLSQKGEIFMRRRPVYAVYERITRAKIEAGLQEDEIPRRMQEKAAFITARGNYSRAAEKFLRGNFLQTRFGLSVAGTLLKPGPGTGSASFTINIPGRYVLLSPNGALSGTIDGLPLTGAAALDAGVHTVNWEGTLAPCLIVWEKAYRTGLIEGSYCRSPYDDPEFYNR